MQQTPTIHNGMLAATLGPQGWAKPWSGSNGGACLEARQLDGGQVALRQSTDPDSPALVLDAGEIRAFIEGAKAGLADYLLGQASGGLPMSEAPGAWLRQQRWFLDPARGADGGTRGKRARRTGRAPRDRRGHLSELVRATEFYEAGPGPGETHGYGMEALTRINLAVARLRAGALDEAAIDAEAVLALPTGKRIATLPQRFDRVRAELAHPIYRGSAQAQELDERIEEFCRETVVADLHSLPAGSG